MTYLQEAIIMTVVKVKLTWCVGIDTEALVMDRHLVSFRTCCPFELEKAKWREGAHLNKVHPLMFTRDSLFHC